MPERVSGGYSAPSDPLWHYDLDLHGILFGQPLCTGGGLGRLGDNPLKFEVGDSPRIRPPIFREVLLLDVRQCTNCLKMYSGGILGCEIELFRIQLTITLFEI